eukprot:7558422-Pyramimonas_sp.AAC.1
MVLSFVKGSLGCGCAAQGPGDAERGPPPLSEASAGARQQDRRGHEVPGRLQHEGLAQGVTTPH